MRAFVVMIAPRRPPLSTAHGGGKAANAQPDFTSAIGFRRDVTITPDGKASIAASGAVSCRSS